MKNKTNILAALFLIVMIIAAFLIDRGGKSDYEEAQTPAGCNVLKGDNCP